MKWIKNIFETEEDKEINDLIVNGQPHWLAQVIVDQRKVRREKVEKHSKINHVRRRSGDAERRFDLVQFQGRP